jgi:prepilin-type N-terminal cleavage/methylation domain-containing protein
MLYVRYQNTKTEKIMKSRQAGFTLVEIAIVLVIIGLLLGGVLKGQELINSAKVKNLAQDFRNVPLFIYGYQDKFRALPGDDAQAAAHVTGTAATTGGTLGNGVIEGAWDSTTVTEESFLFWQHVRLAGLAAGPTSTADTNYAPRNADGGIIGITTNSNTAPYITGMRGTYLVCSGSVLGKYAKQLDSTIDDGCPNTGSLRAVLGAPAGTTTGNVSVGLVPIAAGAVCPITAGAVMDDSASYTVCLTL